MLDRDADDAEHAPPVALGTGCATAVESAVWSVNAPSLFCMILKALAIAFAVSRAESRIEDVVLAGDDDPGLGDGVGELLRLGDSDWCRRYGS